MKQGQEGFLPREFGVGAKNQQRRLLAFKVIRILVPGHSDGTDAVNVVLHPVQAAVHFEQPNISRLKLLGCPAVVGEAVDEAVRVLRERTLGAQIVVQG